MSKRRKIYISHSFPMGALQSHQLDSFTWGVATVTLVYGYQTGYADGQRSIAEIISEESEGEAMTLRIYRLKTKELKPPLYILVEPDDDRVYCQNSRPPSLRIWRSAS